MPDQQGSPAMHTLVPRHEGARILHWPRWHPSLSGVLVSQTRQMTCSLHMCRISEFFTAAQMFIIVILFILRNCNTCYVHHLYLQSMFLLCALTKDPNLRDNLEAMQERCTRKGRGAEAASFIPTESSVMQPHQIHETALI